MNTKLKKAIDTLQDEIDTLLNHQKVIKKYPPNQMYFYDNHSLVRIKGYRLHKNDSWRNAFRLGIIATNLYETYTKLPDLRLLFNEEEPDLIPVDIKDLPTYLYLRTKTPLFDTIIKTGKLPKKYFEPKEKPLS